MDQLNGGMALHTMMLQFFEPPEYKTKLSGETHVAAIYSAMLAAQPSTTTAYNDAAAYLERGGSLVAMIAGIRMGSAYENRVG